MEAVILAAGVGSRLGSLTEQRPKASLEVNGRSLFQRSLNALVQAKVQRVYYVTGHAPEVLRAQAEPFSRDMDVVELWNEHYRRYNNIYSLWITRGVLEGKPFLLLNSDVLFRPSLLRELLNLPEATWLAVDAESPLEEEAMKVTTNGGTVTAIGKELHPSAAQGEYIGIARFDAEGSSHLFKQLERAVLAGRTSHWYEHAINAILPRVQVRLLPVPGGDWVEIDTQEDLDHAESVAKRIDG